MNQPQLLVGGLQKGEGLFRKVRLSVIMPSSRRALLGVVGTALTVGVSGCTDSESRPVSLSISNPTAERRSVFIEILPADIEGDMSENQLFVEWIDLGPNTEDTAYKERQNVFEAQKALVRIKNNRGYINEYTFVPDCADSGTGEHLEVTLTANHRAAVSQNWCRT